MSLKNKVKKVIRTLSYICMVLILMLLIPDAAQKLITNPLPEITMLIIIGICVWAFS